MPFAHASDAGGSIRIPASACGLFGLKPTRGRNPMGPNIGESVAGLSVDHCVSVSVRDSAALLDATGAPEPGAPYQAPAPQGTFLAAVYAPPRKLRIGVMREPCNGAAVDPECLAAVETAAALCRALGHEVTDEFPTLADPERFIGAFGKAYMVAAAVNVEMAERLAGHTAGEDDLEPLTREVARLGRTLSAVDYVQVTRELHAAAREFSRFFNDYDLLLSPTLAQPPVVVGELRFAPDSLVADFMRLGEYAPFTQIFNASGQPAMNVPLYWTADGMPVGVQFAGRYGDEATLFALAGELERAQPWASRLPPLAG
ncbi:6-aminohexanoate-cyclic-dimer hydrolase [compost metagenome]